MLGPSTVRMREMVVYGASFRKAGTKPCIRMYTTALDIRTALRTVREARRYLGREDMGFVISLSPICTWEHSNVACDVVVAYMRMGAFKCWLERMMMLWGV